MRKFTAFTLLLTVIVVVVLAEFFINDYLPELKNKTSDKLELSLPNELDLNKSLQSNVLGADVDYSKINDITNSDSIPLPTEDLYNIEIPLNGDSTTLPLDPTDTALSELLPIPNTISENSENTDTVTDFEDDNFTSFSQNVFIREDQIKSAGFTGAYLEDEPYDGYLYKTIYIDDLKDLEVSKTAIRTSDSLLAKVYVFQVGGLTSVSEIYEVLKMRASEGLDIEINETNDFGSASFYMNDSRRSDTAFLTVKIGSLLYGFSYPKEYHAQIKNLITLLDLEF